MNLGKIIFSMEHNVFNEECQMSHPGARKLMGENLKVVKAEFST